MKNSIGFKIGFSAKRVADTLALGTYDTVMDIGDRFVQFCGDMRSGYRKARFDTVWEREIKPRAEAADNSLSSLGIGNLRFTRKMGD